MNMQVTASMKKRIRTADGITVSYTTCGSGPALVLVHGAFSDDTTNWEFVKPLLEDRFTICAIARRGRSETDATEGHSLEDEARDVATVIETFREPVFLLGHSSGAQCSLAAAALVPNRVRKLILYEPPRPDTVQPAALTRLEALAAEGAWDEFAFSFFKDSLHVPESDLQQLRAMDLWPAIVADARASLGDLRTIARYDFKPEGFQGLTCPVRLQVGSESPRDLYVTDALAACLPDVRVETLVGQAHEGMTTAPEMYAASVIRFLQSEP
jgi:pimeloyl-ACP methyl ester carboxylesterase